MNKTRKKHINLGDVTHLQNKLRRSNLNTVCESAKCPNISECFSRKTATIMILGNSCTRNCRFCAIKNNKPEPIDPNEPINTAKMIKELGLSYAVITSVTRDDLSDGGAKHFAKTINAIRDYCPGTKIEVLVPDFAGNLEHVSIVIEAKPDVFSHNIETVQRVYPEVRSGADYKRSLRLLKHAADSGLIVKSGIMLGLGETETEIDMTLADIYDSGCRILTIGQYLSPSKDHYSVHEHIREQKFLEYKDRAIRIGFNNCLSGRFVRSSYMADTLI